MDPEAKARLEIDRKLEEAGYVLQDRKEMDPTASSELWFENIRPTLVPAITSFLLIASQWE